ncbi:DUF6268 family outer membrane beta-barrel protein [Pseudobythopirellula maris]|uniref:DUF6268 family outer membrane beta-barrel protein n=1 Tax=Pseudobythopirellula maris TaxID=2527991 RepID=UPI0011B85E91|nr:DUF6268 family outer membrane beta-barrel protein [Pseudobythopirellula maris]
MSPSPHYLTDDVAYYTSGKDGPTQYFDPSVYPTTFAPGPPSLGQYCCPSEPQIKMPRGRPGMFQRFQWTGEWFPAIDGDPSALGVSSLGASVMLGAPLPFTDGHLLITPRYEVNYFEGPTVTDMPPRTHEAAVEFGHIRLLSPRWMLNLSTSIGVYGDDHSLDSGDALRITGRAIGIYQATHEWQWIVGVVYLDRDDVPILPALGAVYKSGGFKADLLFPRPKLTWELGGDSRVYLGGEFGGGSWAVARTGTGLTERADLLSYQLFAGVEQGVKGGWNRRIEAGYAFGRELEYAESGTVFELDDTLFVRSGVTY